MIGKVTVVNSVGDDFEEQVNNMIADGYQPYGKMHVVNGDRSCSHNLTRYAIMMVKEKGLTSEYIDTMNKNFDRSPEK